MEFKYSDFRAKVGIARRDTRQLNQVRRKLKDYGVLVFPLVDGKLHKGAEQPWSEFSERNTKVVCRLTGGRSVHEKDATDAGAKTTVIETNAELFITDDNHLTVLPAAGLHPRRLYAHQEKAFQAMTSRMKAGFAGILVLPTGAGKTRVAVQWLLSNVIDQGGRVLWLAHRHSLIDQACNEFCKNGYQGDVLRNTNKFTCRKVSGQHARPYDLSPEDDVVVASVFSVGRGEGRRLFATKWLSDRRPICLVVDEAHHAAAKTYRNVIEKVRDHQPEARILGLTATPDRTAKNERGLLKRIFPDGIIHKVDLQNLLTSGILARPHFEQVETGARLGHKLTDEQVNKLLRSGGEFSVLGEVIAKTLGDNRARNRCIVNQYAKHRGRYGRTIIFALNIVNALALTHLLQEQNVKADYVVSSLHDLEHKVRIDATRNAGVIEQFKNGELEVLVNVNILTEGFDDPTVQSIFLARPTMSSILMTQMVGRGLRGPKAGGTETANIVSFIDDWEDKIQWKSPRELEAREEAEFAESPQARSQANRRLVAVRFIEEFARFLDRDLGANVFGKEAFIKRVPVGFYMARMTEEHSDEAQADVELHEETVLVFDVAQSAFAKMLSGVPAKIPTVGTAAFDRLAERLRERYFGDMDGLAFAPRPEQIRTLLGHIAEFGEPPAFLSLDQREQFDVDAIAGELRELKAPVHEVDDHIRRRWNDGGFAFQAFFRDDYETFAKAVWDALRPAPASHAEPRVVLSQKPVEECSLSELYEKMPSKWKEISDAVYAHARNARSRKYECALTKWQSHNRAAFQIDHIQPRQEGGKTVLDNLRLLRRYVNGAKGASWHEDQ